MNKYKSRCRISRQQANRQFSSFLQDPCDEEVEGLRTKVSKSTVAKITKGLKGKSGLFIYLFLCL